MLLLSLEPAYVFFLALWTSGLAWIIVRLLKKRRAIRVASRSQPRRLSARLNALAMGIWFLAASLTAAELIFALAVDHSEAFNASLIAKRWFTVHFDSQRNLDGFREKRLLTDLMPQGVRRILVLGDSFTAGHGINRMEDRFTERLETQLNEAAQPAWQVYNMGEPGYEISMIRALEQAVLEREEQIDMVIYCYMMNDIEGYDPTTKAAIEQLGQRRSSGNWLVRHSYFINWMYHRWVQYSAGSSVDYFPHLVESYSGPPWNSVAHDLDDMLARCREKGIPFRLLIFPFMHNLGPDYPFRMAHEKLVAWADQNHVPVLDMMPIFESHSAEQLTVNRFDNHPNEKAHAITADAIAKWLNQEQEVSAPAEPATTAPSKE